MKKILVFPNSNNLDLILSSCVDGIILPLKGLSVQSDIYFDLMDIKKILNQTKKEVCVCINKIMHETDLKELKMSLVTLNKMNISKIFFYDVSVLRMCRQLQIRKPLVVYQEHLNASSLSNDFYASQGVVYSFITNDITKEEMNEIAKKRPIMLACYGYLPIFYSRRYLISNYLEHIGKKKMSDIYYIKHGKERYPIREEEFGTCIYTKEPINLINELDELDISYCILNTFLVSNERVIQVISDYMEHKKDNLSHYVGLLSEKTVYRVKDHE